MPPAVLFPARAQDIEWSERHQLLYLSLPSSNGPAGNSVVALDPRTNRVVYSHPTRAEPGEMTLSDDNQYLHVVSNGASTVQRFRLPELTLEREFFLGRGDLGFPFLANDIVAVPGYPKSVVVAMGIDPWVPQPHWVRVYDDGIPRPSELGTVTGGSCWSMALDATGARLFCASTSHSGFDLQEAALGADGLRSSRSFYGVFRHFYARMQFNATTGLIYGSDGTVVEPATARVLSRIEASGAMVPDPQRNRLYYASSSEQSMRTFTADSFAPLPASEGFANSATRLVRWGENGLALATSGNATYVFGGTGNSTFSSATPRGTATERKLRADVKKMVWDPVNGLLYASIGSRAAQFANSIAVIEPFGGRITTTRSVGTEPNELAVSDDGRYLYAGIDGEGSIQRLRLPALDPDITIPLGLDFRQNAYTAGVIRPAPSNSRTIAVNRVSLSTVPSAIGGVAIFDDAAQRPSISQNHPRAGYALNHFDVVWNEDGSKLYSINLYSSLFQLDVSALGISSAAELGAVFSPRSALRYDAVNRLLSVDSGDVIDPVLALPVGRYRLAHNIGAQNVALDPTGATVAALAMGQGAGTPEITVFDSRRFVPLKNYSITGSDATITWDFVQLRPGWFAFRSANGVHIIQLTP